MAIDYSKWDKIELSDDSDIEVHPNVDKRSFIKWKQRDIHEKRAQRNAEIKALLVQLSMYAELNSRLDYLLSHLKPEQWLDQLCVSSTLAEHFDPKQKFDYEQLVKDRGDTMRRGLRDLQFDSSELENMPPYNEMVEDLCVQIKNDEPGAASDPEVFVSHIRKHRAKIDDVLSNLSVKLDELLNEKANLISSDDIHTGFDRSFLNKDDDNKDTQRPANISTESKAPAATILAPAAPSKLVSTSLENAPARPAIATSTEQSSKSAPPLTSADVLDELAISPASAEYAKILDQDLKASASYLIKNTAICNEQQKDALLMLAFEYILDNNDTVGARRVIHQALLLQYIVQLAGTKPLRDLIIRAVKLFCAKVSDNSSPAHQAFTQDVENTYNHIRSRCKILASEREKEAENGDNDDVVDDENALIQLKAIDEGTELSVSLPEPGTPEHNLFSTELSPALQEAVKTQLLDEVNKELAKLSVAEAEKVLEIFNECGVIGVSGYLENEDEFKELQKEYRDHNATEDAAGDSTQKVEVPKQQRLEDEVD